MISRIKQLDIVRYTSVIENTPGQVVSSVGGGGVGGGGQSVNLQ